MDWENNATAEAMEGKEDNHETKGGHEKDKDHHDKHFQW